MTTPTPQPDPPAGGVICPQCGAHNPGWRSTCAACHAWLPRLEDSAPPPPLTARPHRPGCITGWVLLFGAYIAFTAVSFAGVTAASANFSPADLLMLLAMGLVLVIAWVILAGVWQMHAWARLPAIALQVVFTALVILNLFTTSPADTTTPAGGTSGESAARQDFERGADVYSAVFWVVVNGVYIYWFARNRGAFKS